MRSLIYLLLTSFKNWLLDLRRSPGKLILYILFIALLVFTMVISVKTSHIYDDQSGFSEMFYIKGIFFAFLMIFVVTAFLKGLSSGDTFFEMNDVNLLFVSPVNPRQILLYGLIRMMKMAFLSGFFILFQGSNFNRFGIGIGSLWGIFLAYIIAILLSEMVALVVYSVSNGNEKRKNIIKIIAIAIFVPAAIYFLLQYLSSGNFIGAVEALINSPYFSFIPIAGWSTAGVFAFIEGNILSGALYFGLIFLTSAGLLLFIALSKSDYYEDVLLATETAFEKKRAMEDGNMNASTDTSNRKIKVRSYGIGGHGSSAIFYRHLREYSRQNRFVILPTSSIYMVAITLLVCALVKNSFSLLVILQILMWMQVFLIGTGRGLRDLYSHYIYMIPTSSFSRIVWSNLELVLKTLLESILIFGIAGIMMKEHPLVILLCIAVYTLFAMFLIAINYMSLRFTTADISAGILLFFYFLAVMILILPGLIPALVVGISIGGPTGTIIGTSILGGWLLVSSLLFFFFSRGILNHCDMPVAQMKK